MYQFYFIPLSVPKYFPWEYSRGNIPGKFGNIPELFFLNFPGKIHFQGGSIGDEVQFFSVCGLFVSLMQAFKGFRTVYYSLCETYSNFRKSFQEVENFQTLKTKKVLFPTEFFWTSKKCPRSVKNLFKQYNNLNFGTFSENRHFFENFPSPNLISQNGCQSEWLNIFSDKATEKQSKRHIDYA